MIKKLARYIKGYKKDSILTPIFVMLEVIMEVLIPFLMADLIDKGIDGGNIPLIIKLGLALLIGAFISLFFGALAGKTAATASAGFAKNLRKGMFYNIQDFSLQAFTISLIVSTPALCPKLLGSILFLAQRPFPSIIIPI